MVFVGFGCNLLCIGIGGIILLCWCCVGRCVGIVGILFGCMFCVD